MNNDAVENDVVVVDEGSIALLVPKSEIAIVWIEEHIAKDDSYQPYWPTVVVEHRYVDEIVEGMIADGLIVTG